MAKALGDAKVAVIRAHGSVVVADNLKALFFFCVYFEKNAQRLLEAYASGTPEPLFSVEDSLRYYDVFPNGDIVTSVDQTPDYTSVPLVVVRNWIEELRRNEP